jgi:hypothetical protein
MLSTESIQSEHSNLMDGVSLPPHESKVKAFTALVLPPSSATIGRITFSADYARTCEITSPRTSSHEGRTHAGQLSAFSPLPAVFEHNCVAHQHLLRILQFRCERRRT